MSRVEEQQKNAQIEAERQQAKADRAARDAKRGEQQDRFASLVQKAKPDPRPPGARPEAKTQHQRAGEQAARHEQDAARMARLARGGTLQHGRILEQVKSFQGTLETQKAESASAQQVRSERREEGLGMQRQQNEERVGDLEQKQEQRVESEREQARVEAREEARANAAIDGQAQGRGQGGSGSSGGDRSPGEGGQRSPKAVGEAEGARGSAGASPVQQIPEAILQALADRVFVGVNERGMAEFRVELKEGILQGASMRVSAEGGRIHLAFEGLEGNAKRLVQACEGDLARRLEAKGLRLASLRTG